MTGEISPLFRSLVLMWHRDPQASVMFLWGEVKLFKGHMKAPLWMSTSTYTFVIKWTCLRSSLSQGLPFCQSPILIHNKGQLFIHLPVLLCCLCDDTKWQRNDLKYGAGIEKGNDLNGWLINPSAIQVVFSCFQGN